MKLSELELDVERPCRPQEVTARDAVSHQGQSLSLAP
jgi:hypothetical protein